MNFPVLLPERLTARLMHPGKKIAMVLDTDTYNEVDDQFALAYALRSPETMDVQAVYAAPFLNARSRSAQDGMEKSYDEIINILRLLGKSADGFVFKGSTDYLQAAHTAQPSDAARDLVQRAMARDDDDPLYVVAIGAITNVASAILMEPQILRKIVVVWLGGHALFWHDTSEFNLRQDIHASRLVLDCGVPLIHVPCMGVTTHLATTVPELEHYLMGKNALGTYLTDIVRGYADNLFGWSKVIWDVAAVAWLVNQSWFTSGVVASPVLTDQLTWSVDPRRHAIRSIYHLNRDAIFADLFSKLSQ